jgi:hypothetical protein
VQLPSIRPAKTRDSPSAHIGASPSKVAANDEAGAEVCAGFGLAPAADDEGRLRTGHGMRPPLPVRADVGLEI